MDRKLLTALLLVVVLGTALRLFSIHSGVLLDPDDYFLYGVVQQTVSHNFAITSQLSGFPIHNPYNEGDGLIYLDIAVSFFSNNLLTGMFLLPVLFGVLEILATYVLATKLTKNYYVGLLAAFLFAIMPGAILKNVAGEYRGDTIVPFLLALTVIIILYARERKSCRLLCLAVIPVIASLWVWRGGVYAVAILAIFSIAYLLNRRLKSLWKVAGVVLLLSLVGMLLFVYLESVGVYRFTSAFDSVAELQMPTVNWLVLSTGLAMAVAPIGVLIYLLKSLSPRFRRRDDAAFLAVLSMLIPAFLIQLTAIRWSSLLSVPLAIFSAYALMEIYKLKRVPNQTNKLIVISIIAIAILSSVFQIPYQNPGNDPNAQFFNALSWVRNNTAPNATFLTAWPDGSYIEGIGQRTSYSDSVTSQAVGWQQFPDFLFAKAGNFTYLEQVHPDYLFVRQFWVAEREGLALEGGLYYNTSINGTNLQLLTTQNAISGLTLVFQNNDTRIFAVR